MTVWDRSNNRLIAHNVHVASHFFQRLRGLIGTGGLGEGEGLCIPQCQGVHTFGMKYPLDIIYLNRLGEVVSLVSGLLPNRLGPVNFNSSCVLELASGFILAKNVSKGAQLLLID